MDYAESAHVWSSDSTEQLIFPSSLYICPKKERCPWMRLQVVDYRLKTCMLKAQFYEEKAIILRRQIEAFNQLPQCVNEAQRKLFVEQHQAFSRKLQRHVDLDNWLQDCCKQLIEKRCRFTQKVEEHGLCSGFDATRE
ncbi:hypothetical protein BIW11_05985 [Tropilaelaps mercedesae]|uniref:Uncharacterized protein n=1 Tax=Tropilaelaps mercedesae TaxID=418985 RepID=A0A1V9Y023_9ACAR|nr:hypothetical protein BIW11_05985 [Tropilaelaps mercedesae]